MGTRSKHGTQRIRKQPVRAPRVTAKSGDRALLEDFLADHPSAGARAIADNTGWPIAYAHNMLNAWRNRQEWPVL
jgi:hypothetical protein